MTYTLHHGDCLDILPTLPSGSIDAVIADPPYGTTACKWDSVIPLEAMWRELKRVIKPRGAVVLFAAQPFTTKLINSNAEWFKYCWYWQKNMATGFAFSKTQPLRAIEEMCVFYCEQPTYNKQPTKSIISDRTVVVGRKNGGSSPEKGKHTPNLKSMDYVFPEYVAPRNVLEISCVPNAKGKLHPTQKPVELLRYLVRTYTNPGETVLDFTMGSGTTGVACAMEGRHFIGVELDAGYFDIAKRRIEQVQPALMEAAD